MSYAQAALMFIGTGTVLFLAAVMVGLGLHLGLRLGANWFGAIKVTTVQHKYFYSRPSTPEGE